MDIFLKNILSNWLQHGWSLLAKESVQNVSFIQPFPSYLTGRISPQHDHDLHKDNGYNKSLGFRDLAGYHWSQERYIFFFSFSCGFFGCFCFLTIQLARCILG